MSRIGDNSTWTSQGIADNSNWISDFCFSTLPRVVLIDQFAHSLQYAVIYSTCACPSFVNIFENFESDEAKVMFGTFAAFVGLSPDNAGGGKIASLFASVIQDKVNNLMEFS